MGDIISIMGKLMTLFSEYWLILIVIALISYFIGSINFSILVTKGICGNEDIRNVGSGNAGFTNVLRVKGRVPAFVTFIGDFSKGVFAVWIAKGIGGIFPELSNDMELFQYVAYISAFMCVIGHIYPCFFGFKGGKGILTGWSVTLLIDWRIFLIIISVFIVILLISKIVSLSSISAAMSYPIATFLIIYSDYRNFGGNFYYIIVCTTIAFITAAVVVMKHKSNIKRIILGKEKRISIKK